jgi:hypothetical protein
MTNPSLLIVPDRFKASKLYSQLPQDGSGDFVVTRATTAYRTNAAGILESVANNVPRLDFPIGSGCPALLVEPAATNLALRSEEFDDAYWTKEGATISSNATIAPDGTTTADKIVEEAVSGTHRAGRATFASGTQRTFSVFAKKGERNFVSLFENNTVGNAVKGVIFNINTGIVSLNNDVSYYSNPTIQDFGNGWYRCSATWTPTSLSVPSVGISADGLTNSYTGVATDGIFLWGAQLETGSVATSYIPTVAATATRNADVINKTAVSGLIGQTEGVVYAEFNLSRLSTTEARRVICISDGTNAEAVFLNIAPSNELQARIRVGGVNQYQFFTAPLTAGTYKVALAYNANDFALYLNGVQSNTSASGNVPACSQLFIGKIETSASTNMLNDRIRAAALYTTRLSNAQLQFLTTL